MKLTESTITIESSGEMEEQFFSIQDQGMIFDILRNKMYSDPILAICREISCNARDAHREVGKRDQCIEITLPTALEPFYKIKDFGPGISPDRMQNVFIKYTASTKRNDNSLTGGFGLGAKTPFSYSDTFTIITVVNNIKYNYACFIDETKVGKLILMGQEDCIEENSTQIVIPVKTQDFNKFSVSTEECTRHWDVKPIIKNGFIKYTEYSPVFGNFSTLWKNADEIDSKNRTFYNRSYNRGVKVIVDGIEYNISMEALRKFADTKVVDACKGYLFLYFNIGELSLAANRESIYIDKPTESKLIERLNLVSKEIIDIVNKQIITFPTYLEANKFYCEELIYKFNDSSFLGKLCWKNIILHGHNINLNNKVTLFYKGKVLKGKSAGLIKIRSNTHHTVSLTKDTKIFFNDTNLTTISLKHINKIFEDTTINTVQIINLSKNQTFADLDQKYSLTGIGVNQLSTIVKSTATVNRANYANKLLIFKMDKISRSLVQVPYTDLELDNNKIKVLCLFDRDKAYIKNDKRIILENGKSAYVDKLYNLAIAYPDVSFYSVGKETDKTRLKKEFVGFITLDQFINDNLKNSLNECIEFKSMETFSTYSFFDESQFDNLKSQILNYQSLYLKKINLYQKIINNKKNKHKVIAYEAFVDTVSDSDIKNWLKNNPQIDYHKLTEQCSENYPLLNNHYISDIKTEHISQYINFIDNI